jgi:AcrR family transcriptional regulator
MILIKLRIMIRIDTIANKKTDKKRIQSLLPYEHANDPLNAFLKIIDNFLFLVIFMDLSYAPPRQNRAKTTEQRFLDALQELLHDKSLSLVTIDEIANKARLTRSAFLKRFGTKKNALFILYEFHCKKALTLFDEVSEKINNYDNVLEACKFISACVEKLHSDDFPANRAMHEIFTEQLCIADQTKILFRKCVELMKKIQFKFLPEGSGTEVGAHAAAQLIFTINYYYVMKAMPGLPRDHSKRHQLIAVMVVDSLDI